MRECRTLEDGCTVCDEQLAQPSQNAVFTLSTTNGWDASAVSIDSFYGDCYTQFSVTAAAGIAVGITDRRVSGTPADVKHGVLIQSINGVSFAVSAERGIPVSEYIRHKADNEYRVEMFGNRASVLARVDGAWSMLSDRVALFSAKRIVMAALYSGQDSVE